MTKRIVSLLMAVMLVIGIFAVPAMAAQDDDGIELYGPVIRCDNCFASITKPTDQTWAENGTVYTTCYKSKDYHEHFKSWKVTGWRCPSCGAWTEMSRKEMSDSCSISVVTR